MMRLIRPGVARLAYKSRSWTGFRPCPRRARSTRPHHRTACTPAVAHPRRARQHYRGRAHRKPRMLAGARLRHSPRHTNKLHYRHPNGLQATFPNRCSRRFPHAAQTLSPRLGRTPSRLVPCTERMASSPQTQFLARPRFTISFHLDRPLRDIPPCQAWLTPQPPLRPQDLGDRRRAWTSFPPQTDASTIPSNVGRVLLWCAGVLAAPSSRPSRKMFPDTASTRPYPW